ncbi:MAG TPA: autotransporter outer membrane beta-barrel domain-containing protein, partial [Stellaceae bacterium]|nr:autotransporter outer membrane beta-barrel domain-containing protein [Stellaceae bacterium]
GNFTALPVFKDFFSAKAPVTVASISATTSILTPRLTPDGGNANALDLTLVPNQAGLAQSAQTLTQDLRFGLEAPLVMEESIQHRLVSGGLYDGGGVGAASLSDPGHQVAGGIGVPDGDEAGRGNLWARGYGVLGDSSPFETRRVGVLVGGDWRLDDHLVIGLALDYDHTDARFSDASSTKLDAYQGAAYAGWDEGPWYATALAGAGINEFSTTRQLASVNLAGIASSHPAGATYETYAEAGYRLKAASLTLTPYLGAGYTHTALDGFTETGGFGALTINAGSSDSLATTLGVRASTVINLGASGTLVPELRLGYAHEFLDAAQTLNGSLFAVPFSATGVNFGRDSALVGVGVTHAVNGATRIFVDYDGKITGSFQEHAVSAGLRISF